MKQECDVQSTWDAIVIGAGVAGLAAAQELVLAGRSVLVLDKARRPGGRCATRRTAPAPDAPWFDLGAQYFTQRDARFREALEALPGAAVFQLWQGRLGAVSEDGSLQPSSPDHRRYVCAGGMNALGRSLAGAVVAAGGELQTACHVVAVAREDSCWVVTGADGQAERASCLVVAIPGPQASELLGGHYPRACSPDMTPCLSMVVRVQEALDYDGIFMNDPVLDWAANNHSKPGHPGGDGALWTLHAQPDFSAEALATGAVEHAHASMLRAFRRLGELTLQPVATQSWRFARPAQSAAPGFYRDADQGLALCGDWLNGGRVEGAWLSGHQLGCELAAAAATRPGPAGG